MSVLGRLADSIHADTAEVVENSITRLVLKDFLRPGRRQIDMADSEDVIKKANANAWRDLEAMQENRRQMVAHYCTKSGKRKYDESMSIAGGGAYDVAEYIKNRINFHVFCNALENGHIFCVDMSLIDVKNATDDMNTTWHTCTFIDLNLHIDGEHFAPLLPGLLTQLHRMEVNDLRRLRQSEYEGFVARKRETMIISMLSTLEMMVDFSMRETLDGRVLFFATFFGVDFKGIEKPFCCPFCRQVTEVDLCSLHKKKVYDNKCKEGRSRYNLRESTTKIRGGESKKVCDMIGCENSVEFMPSLTCSLKCTPTFCYECVWKCVTNKQDLLPVMLSE